jgi:hypothetical protein
MRQTSERLTGKETGLEWSRHRCTAESDSIDTFPRNTSSESPNFVRSVAFEFIFSCRGTKDSRALLHCDQSINHDNALPLKGPSPAEIGMNEDSPTVSLQLQLLDVRSLIHRYVVLVVHRLIPGMKSRI